MEHLTTELLDRMRRRELEPDELLAIASHLETCPECAGRGREYARNDLAALQRELAPEREPHRIGIWLAAAATVMVVLLSAFWFTREKPATPREPGVEEAHTPAPAQPPPTPPSAATETATATTYADPEWERLVADTKRSGVLPFPAGLEELRGTEEVLRGENDPSQRITPAGVVIDEVPPTFRWHGQPSKTYVVFIYDGRREIARSGELDAPRWRADRDLPRERTLTWQVEASGGDSVETIPEPPAPPARFRIVSEATHRELDRARREHPDDHLLHAVLFARAGMRNEAVAAMQRAKAR
jgi:hypothetical protein